MDINRARLVQLAGRLQLGYPPVVCAVQSQKAVTAHFSSEQLLPFDFAGIQYVGDSGWYSGRGPSVSMFIPQRIPDRDALLRCPCVLIHLTGLSRGVLDFAGILVAWGDST